MEEEKSRPVYRLEIRAVEPEDVGGGIGGCLAEVRWHRVVPIVTGQEELVRLGGLRISAAGFLPAGLRLRADGLAAPEEWELAVGALRRVSLTIPSEDAYDDDAQYSFLLLPGE